MVKDKVAALKAQLIRQAQELRELSAATTLNLRGVATQLEQAIRALDISQEESTP